MTRSPVRSRNRRSDLPPAYLAARPDTADSATCRAPSAAMRRLRRRSRLREIPAPSRRVTGQFVVELVAVLAIDDDDSQAAADAAQLSGPGKIGRAHV